MSKKAVEPTEFVADKTKSLIPDPTLRIVLNEYAATHVRALVTAIRLERFPASTPFTAEAFADRLQQYEGLITDVRTIAMLIAYWAEPRHQALLERIVCRLGEAEKGNAGTVGWLRLGWYPLLIVQYTAGIAAIAAGNWESLRTILTARIENDEGGLMVERAGIVRVSRAIGEIVDAFKSVSGNPQHYVPLSEYLFGALRKPVEETVDVGPRYERIFDRFEILAALTCADELQAAGSGPWCLLGRFAWKRNRGDDPFAAVVAEAERQADSWSPLRAGLFGGSSERFRQVASEIGSRLGRLGWF